jgi:hypothetical protein
MAASDQAQARDHVLVVALQDLAVERERAARIARAQERVGVVEPVGRVLVCQRAGPGLEVGIELHDRVGVAADRLVVVGERGVGLVAIRPPAHHLLEQGHAFFDLVGDEQLGAQRGQHVRIVRSEQARPPQQRDALAVLLAQRVHGRAQHVGVDAARVDLERLVEQEAGLLVVLGRERHARVLDVDLTLLVAPRVLRAHEHGREREAERQAHGRDESPRHSPSFARAASSRGQATAPRLPAASAALSLRYLHTTKVVSSSAG